MALPPPGDASGVSAPNSMNYLSTRNKDLRITAAQAIVKGLAPDGGLLTPAVVPRLPASALDTLKDMSYQQRMVYVMNGFLEGFSSSELSSYADAAYGGVKFSDPDIAPVRDMGDGSWCLELWHGPTCAFKDMALQILPYLLVASLGKSDEKRDVCILVATSGDTGKAALEGFRDVDKTKVLVFYPKDGVSDIQELQMLTQEGGNVAVCAVKGNFDDAQTGVKKLFADEALAADLTEKGYFLSSANSINWGRILAQIVYYISAYCDLLRNGAISRGEEINFCVPTGNFGNILAAYYAKTMGVPVHRLICASNSNNVLTDFLKTGVYDRNRTFYNTISPSMDILISSNLERMIFEISNRDDRKVREYMNQLSEIGSYRVSSALRARMQNLFAAGWCDEDQTRAKIAEMWEQKHYLIDPHTAVAFHVLDEYRAETGDRAPTVVVSTASPFKFCNSVLDSLGIHEHRKGLDVLDQIAEETGVPVPAPLARLRGRRPRFGAVAEKGEMEQVVRDFLK